MAKNFNRLKSVQGESPDPYLRAFLRQAVAIITVERGINDSSKSKLQVLADQLGLSNDTFQKALEQLKQPDNALGLNRYEKKYVERLAQEFENLRGKVLNIRAEQTLVDLAESRFQINAVRAHQLIQKIAQQFNVGIISHADAEQFAIQLIEDKVGTRTALEHSEISRLYKTCEKWGFEKLKVDQVVRLAILRNQSKRRKSLIRLCGLALVLVVILGGVAYAISMVDWRSLVAANNIDNQLSTPSLEEMPSFPEWWNPSMIAAYKIIAQFGNQQAREMKQLIDCDDEKANQIYRNLIDEKLDRSQLDIDLAAFIAVAHALEPSQANANAILAHVERWIRLPEDSPASASQIRKSVAATQLFSIMLFEARKSNPSNSRLRRNQLEGLNESYFGVGDSDEREAYYTKAVENLTIDQWAHALRNCSEHPREVASFLHELENRVLDDRSAINEIRTRVVRSILSSDPSLWRTFRNSIVKSINESNPVLRESWIRFAGQLPNSPFKEFIDENLASVSQIQTGNSIAGQRVANSNATPEVDSKALRTRNRIELQILDLENKLRVAGIQNENLPELEWDQFPMLVSKLSNTNNVLLAWREFRDGRCGLDEVNRLLSQPGEWVLPVSNSVELPKPTAFEEREFQTAFKKIFDSNENQVSSRISAFKAIESLAARFSNIDYGQAKKLVSHIFSPLSVRESLAIERLLPQLAHWVNFKLAIADSLAELNQREKLQDTLNLLQVNVDLDDTQDWQAKARDELLRNSQEILASQMVDQEDQWRSLQQQLKDLQSARVGLITSDQSADSAYEKIQEWIATRHSNTKYWLRRLEMIGDHEDELEKMIGLNDLLNQAYFELENVDFGNMGTIRNDSTLDQAILRTELSMYKVLSRLFDESSPKHR